MYIAIFLKDSFTVRKEGGLSNEEFKQGCRIDGDPSPSWIFLMDRYTLRGFQYYSKENWEHKIYKKLNEDRAINGEFRADRYKRVDDSHLNYPDEKRPYPRMH